MATFAVIEEGKVINVIIADNQEIAELVTQKTCVEYTETKPAGIGWTYDGKKFNEPVIEIPKDADTQPTA